MEKWEGYLSHKLHKFHNLKLICTHDFGLCLFSEIILYRLLSFHIGFLLSRVDNHVSIYQKLLFLLVMGEQPGALNLSIVQRLSTSRRVHYQMFHSVIIFEPLYDKQTALIYVQKLPFNPNKPHTNSPCNSSACNLESWEQARGQLQSLTKDIPKSCTCMQFGKWMSELSFERVYSTCFTILLH